MPTGSVGALLLGERVCLNTARRRHPHTPLGHHAHRALVFSLFLSRRLATIAANRAQLLELGLTPLARAPPAPKRAAPPKPKKVFAPSASLATPSPSPERASPRSGGRTSSRVQILAALREGREKEAEEARARRAEWNGFGEGALDREEREVAAEGEILARLDRRNRPSTKIFGHQRNTHVGQWTAGRMEMSQLGIHGPPVGGISGNEHVGCWSIALSGGYESDIDLGYSFTYTGSGGRDLSGTKAQPKNLRTAPQTRDQEFTSLNLALKRSAETGKPVRVIRGFKNPSPFAPATGYSYSGLYVCRKAWMGVGATGFKVCQYAFVRMPGQPPLPVQAGREAEARELLGELAPLAEEAETNAVAQAEEVAVVSEEAEEAAVAVSLVGKAGAEVPPTPAVSVLSEEAPAATPTRKRKADAAGAEEGVAAAGAVVPEGVRRSTRRRSML